MQYFGCIDFDMIGRLSFADYDIIIEAIEKKVESADKDLHYGAYLTELAGERDEKGRPKYPTFKDFYKHKSAEQSRFEGLKKYYRSKQ